MNTSSQFPNLMGPTALPGLAQRMTAAGAKPKKEKGDRAYRAATDGAADGADPAEARPSAAYAAYAVRRSVNAPLVPAREVPRLLTSSGSARIRRWAYRRSVCWHCYEKHVEGIAMLAWRSHSAGMPGLLSHPRPTGRTRPTPGQIRQPVSSRAQGRHFPNSLPRV